MSTKRGGWGTRFGFYLAAIGSAFGLGNLWRFPYVVADNGGGAFVLLYIFLVFIIGTPFLIGELLLGKSTRNSVLLAMKRLAAPDSKSGQTSMGRAEALPVFRRITPVAGYLSLILCMVVLAYYAVISGWVLHFLMQFLVALFSTDSLKPEATLQVLLNNGWLQILLTSAHLVIVFIVVAKDVEEGIERWVGYMMPVFGMLLVTLAVKSLSMDSAPDAMRFLLYPDFSRLTLSSLGQALGHVLFTLSIGFGTMVTFGAYLKESAYTPLAGFRVATVDSIISMFAGIMIFPLVLASSYPISGPELLFQTVPVLFSRIPGGIWFGLGFFLCLYLASVSASIGLLETVVANLKETRKWGRTRAAARAGAVTFILAIVPALSSSTFSAVRYGNKGLLELLDSALINWLLPISALVTSQVVCYLLKDEVKRGEFLEQESATSEKMYSHWIFVLRWLATPLIVLALSLQLFDLIRN